MIQLSFIPSVWHFELHDTPDSILEKKKTIQAKKDFTVIFHFISMATYTPDSILKKNNSEKNTFVFPLISMATQICN